MNLQNTSFFFPFGQFYETNWESFVMFLVSNKNGDLGVAFGPAARAGGPKPPRRADGAAMTSFALWTQVPWEKPKVPTLEGCFLTSYFDV